MKKLALELQALEVEGFQPADAEGPRGTTSGADARTLPLYCVTFTCGDSHVRPLPGRRLTGGFAAAAGGARLMAGRGSGPDGQCDSESNTSLRLSPQA